MDPELEVIDGTDPTPNSIPTPNIEPDLSGFEVVEEHQAGPSVEELAAQLEAIKQENEKLKQVSDLSTGMNQGFQTLAQQLQAQQGNQFDNLPNLPQTPQAQQQNFALPDKEVFEKEFMLNPYDAFQKMLAPVVGSQNAAISSQMSEMNKMISKNNAYMNESNKDILSKYGDEVSVYASRFTSQDPWGDAVKQVRTNHFQDIMNEKLELTKQEAYEKAKADLEAAKADLNKGPSSPVGGTNLGGMTNPQAAKVKITKAEMDKVKQMTIAKFGPDSGPETELQMYNYMKSNGML